MVAMLAPPAQAAPTAPVEVPEPLKAWQAWVLHGHEDALCPFLQGVEEPAPCAWPASLTLELGDKGGRFTQRWRTWKKSWVALPGDVKAWPQEVKVDGKAAVVAAPSGGDDDDLPRVLLLPGEHTVSGSFSWDDLPESLAVPSETGLLSLAVRGTRLVLPARDDEGRVLLGKNAAKVEADVLDMTVHRQLSDSIPVVLTTRIQLRVSGRGREVTLGRALPDGFVPMSIDAKVPARVEADGRVRVQVRPGTWEVMLTARHEGPVTAIKRPAPDGEWPPEEVWAFDARPDLRLVTVEGVVAIDPQQTSLPEAWKQLPCYPMKLGDQLQLVQHRRGDAEPAPDRLTLHRDLWLDFDGSGYTVSDRIKGPMNRAWRLEVEAPTVLGRVAVDGKDQFITRSGSGGRAGVEVRQGLININADSRVPGPVGTLPAVSWATDFNKVEGRLHLPPGWRLFHASGADEVPETWVRQWTLLDLFLVLIMAMAVARLYGVRWGVLALVTLTLLFREDDAPKWTFLALLVIEALVRVLQRFEGRLRTVVGWARLLARITLALYALIFSVQQVRGGMYPALEHEQSSSFSFPLPGTAAAPMAEAVAPPAEPSDAPMSAAAPKAGSGEETVRKAPMKKLDSVDGLLDARRDVVVGGLAGDMKSSAYRGGAGGRGVPAQYANEYDPNAMVQTGPGLPSWSWNDVTIKFSGPVEHGQEVHLWLMPPWLNFALALLRVLLLGALVVLLLGLPDRLLPPLFRRGGGLVAPLLLLLFMGAGGRAHAGEVPPQPLLDELQKRLLEKPECFPNCASSPRLILEVEPHLLRARMEVGAAADTAVPLPGDVRQWVPERVLVDGKPAPALRRDDAGKLWLQLSAGSHQVLMEGPLPERDTVQIALPLKSHRVEARASGWSLAGLHEDGLADDDLQLSRVRENKREGGAASLQPGALPPFVRVERELHVGLLWQVDTKVVRLTPTGSAVVLEVPLLPGESVTTPEVRVQGQKALVNMGPNATEVSWHSLLQERPALELAAPSSLPWTEVWRLDSSPIWHVELTGIPMIHRHNDAGVTRPEWQPWPGEKVKIAITKPMGVPGRTLTIDHSALVLRPGTRSSDATLTLSLRSSRGGQHVVTLPEGAQLQQITVNGTSQPIRQDKRAVTLPLLPGSQTIELTWRQPTGVGVRFATPDVDLGAPSVNADQTIELGADRWTLFCGGPRLGPAVLFWSFVLVLVLVSLGLGRMRSTPLRWGHWLLLGLGLSPVPMVAAAVVAGWILLLGWRGERPAPEMPPWKFDLRQLFLAAWTVVALIVLAVSIHGGLLGTPDMQVSGNASGATTLRWFQDRVDGQLPRAWVLSVPIVLYRVAMLAWALWLALSMMKWLRWGWRAFSIGGLWRKAPPRPMRLAPSPPPASSSGAPPAASPSSAPPITPPPA
jgi:hypothetical protein